MKKLLITTMAAVSVGLCAKAADYDGTKTSFENYDAGAALLINDDDEERVWTSLATDSLFVISNITKFANSTKPSRPDYWAKSSDEKALTIDTDAPLFCKVNNRNTPYTFSESNGPIFFDSVVQFTATDVPAAPESGDKLRVWLYESSEEVAQENSGEVSSAKKLVVTAAYNDNGTYVTKHYYTDAEIEPDSWHRLTIKSFTNNGFVTFSVWVDETLVSSEGVTEFLSLQYTENLGGTAIQCVAFDGKGAVDDIVFTTTVPEFAKESEEPTVETYTLNIAGENFTYQVYTDSEWGDKVTDLTAINTEYKTLWLGITPTENYELESIKLGNQTIELPEYNEDDKVYYLDELQISTGDIDNGAEFTLTITMKEKAGGGSGEEPEDPEVPAKPTIGGNAVDNAGDFIAAANSGATIKVPTEWTLVDNTLKDAKGEEYATFADYYKVTLATDGTITLELNNKAEPTIDETAADKGDAIVVTDVAVALGVTNAKVGLWYGAQAYSDAACTTPLGGVTDWEKAEGTTVTVTAKKPEGDKAFFKVVVTDIAPKSTEE